MFCGTRGAMRFGAGITFTSVLSTIGVVILGLFTLPAGRPRLGLAVATDSVAVDLTGSVRTSWPLAILASTESGSSVRLISPMAMARERVYVRPLIRTMSLIYLPFGLAMPMIASIWGQPFLLWTIFALRTRPWSIEPSNGLSAVASLYCASSAGVSMADR